MAVTTAMDPLAAWLPPSAELHAVGDSSITMDMTPRM